MPTRPDNRQPDQMRPVSIETGYLKTAEGSALITVGNTRVLCAATIDLCYEEDSAADVDMNVVTTGGGRFIELQATAEHRTFDHAQMGSLIALAQTGIAELVEAQKRVVKLG